jgi:tetratricopeptide (TPR) repeat protein
MIVSLFEKSPSLYAYVIWLLTNIGQYFHKLSGVCRIRIKICNTMALFLKESRTNFDYQRNKIMNRIALRICLAVTLLGITMFAGAAMQLVQIPVASRLMVSGARQPIQLQQVDVKAEVLGSIAHTRIEMVFYNPNTRVLEGQLQFPLLDGQTVTGFALDINGELRPAVPVDKVRGQQVFEDVSRKRIDPGLLEKTQGNNYKLRIYPLPANGIRRVVLELDETLPERHDKSGIRYQLPLHFAEPIGLLIVSVNNAAAMHSKSAIRARLGAEPIAVQYTGAGHSGSQVYFSRRNFVGHALLSIDYPVAVRTLTAIETRSDQTYFYAEVPVPRSKPALRAAPKNIAIIWDASGSGAARDHDREFALLDAYFNLLGKVTVQLVIARDVAEPVQSFVIKKGDWYALRRVLESVSYDGASSAAALSPPKSTNLNLLFSDGLDNYGTGRFVAGDAPLFTVSAAASADLVKMRAAAEDTGGRMLNLLNLAPSDALTALTHQSVSLSGMHGAKELVSASVYPENGRITIAGILSAPDAILTLDWRDASGEHRSQQVVIRNAPASGIAASRWARLQLAKLEADYKNNRAAIRRLGNRFGMVTRETSLIVLDSIDDYVKYEIVPPESLKQEYESKLVQKNQHANNERSTHLNDIAQRFAQKIDWWKKRFPKVDKPLPPRQKEESSGHSWWQRFDSSKQEQDMRIQGGMPIQGNTAIRSQRSDSAQRERTEVDAPAAAPAPVVAPAGMMVMSSAPALKKAKDMASNNSSVPLMASIQLKKWQSDATYVKRLRETSPEQMYRVYLDERPGYTNSTAFFLDAADIFIERGQTALGLRILSNLAEMNLENRDVLRILAYRLLQAKQTKLALPVLQQVLVLSPEEPQSWRDLGLAYAEDGQYQKAVDNLWEVVSQPWHGRFPDIELIALAEMNAIIARSPILIDTSRMDARLLRNLPLDVRAVLSWDADNTDIDLWVTDPNNEKVYYANRLGYQGGAMSRDFTGGYGPEEFSLHNAKPGKYTVQAHFFGNHQQVVAGATTLMLRLSTGFGTVQQKDENVILRLTGQGSEVDVATFEVK